MTATAPRPSAPAASIRNELLSLFDRIRRDPPVVRTCIGLLNPEPLERWYGSAPKTCGVYYRGSGFVDLVVTDTPLTTGVLAHLMVAAIADLDIRPNATAGIAVQVERESDATLRLATHADLRFAEAGVRRGAQLLVDDPLATGRSPTVTAVRERAIERGVDLAAGTTIVQRLVDTLRSGPEMELQTGDRPTRARVAVTADGRLLHAVGSYLRSLALIERAQREL